MAAIGLSGTFKNSCSSASEDNTSYWDQSLVFSGNTFSADWYLYSDSACSTKLLVSKNKYSLDIGDSYTLADGTSAYKGVLSSESITVTYYNSTYVSDANSSSYC